MDASKLSITDHHQYNKGQLETTDLHPDPLRLYQQWLAYARESNVPEPEAISLATATSDGIPSNRMVLLKAIEAGDDSGNPGGLVWYSNYTSRKAKEMQQNPHAAICIYWKELERQIRAVGKVEKLSTAESDAYYKTRPIGSRIGAHASPQSQPIKDRSVLDERLASFEQKFKEAGEVGLDVPEYWGGYRLIPTEVEFWQGRNNRLHDRFAYTRKDESWEISRLAP